MRTDCSVHDRSPMASRNRPSVYHLDGPEPTGSGIRMQAAISSSLTDTSMGGDSASLPEFSPCEQRLSTAATAPVVRSSRKLRYTAGRAGHRNVERTEPGYAPFTTFEIVFMLLLLAIPVISGILAVVLVPIFRQYDCLQHSPARRDRNPALHRAARRSGGR